MTSSNEEVSAGVRQESKPWKDENENCIQFFEILEKQNSTQIDFNNLNQDF